MSVVAVVGQYFPARNKCGYFYDFNYLRSQTRQSAGALFLSEFEYFPISQATGSSVAASQ